MDVLVGRSNSLRKMHQPFSNVQSSTFFHHLPQCFCLPPEIPSLSAEESCPRPGKSMRTGPRAREVVFVITPHIRRICTSARFRLLSNHIGRLTSLDLHNVFWHSTPQGFYHDVRFICHHLPVYYDLHKEQKFSHPTPATFFCSYRTIFILTLIVTISIVLIYFVFFVGRF